MSSRSSSRSLHGFLVYYDELVGTWVRKLGNRHDAEDVAQDAVVRMLETDGAAVLQPRAYFHQIARNLATDTWRRQAAHESVSLDAIDEFAAPDGDPHVALRASEMVSAIEAALAELPLKCRQVFVWQRIDGLTQAEIAERMGLSKNMVEKYMIRTMRHLRERLTAFDSD
jgi:RNA polymerase sigma factor (sigma-70 family)